MRDFRRKGVALLMTVLMLGVAACGEDGANKQQGENIAGEQSPTDKANQAGNEQNANEQDTENADATDKKDEVTENKDAVDSTDKTEALTATVTLSDAGIAINGTGCEADGNRLKIKAAGTYEISGTLSNGSIYVNVDNESEVHLILNGVTVHNETSAPLFCKKAAKVTITLAEGSENVFSDGAEYVFEPQEDEPDSTIYAKHDLVIEGEGTLKVTAAYGDAIKGKDSLYINGGVFEVKSIDDGIVGRDLLHITGGIFDVQAESDAIKTSNDVDVTLGNIIIDGGTFTLVGDSDDIQAENKVTINGGTLALSAGEDGIQSENGTEINGGVISEIE